MTLTLWIAASMVLLVLMAAWRGHRELVRWLGRDPHARQRALRALLLAAGGALVAWAWLHSAQQPPRFSGAGIDVVLAIDTSTSMDARDSAPSRLRRALRLAEQLVQSADGARRGLVIFAGDAYVALPLTLDRDAHLTYLQAIDSDVLSHKGSDIARALRVSAGAFDPRSPRPRVLVLLSDGEHGGGNLDDVLVELRGAGIRVLAVGFGRPEGEAVPGPRGGPLFDSRGSVILSRRSDPILERIARDTDGSYYREIEDSPDPASLLPPARELATAGEPPGTRLLQLLLAASFLLLAAELWVSSAPLPRRPLRPAAALAALLLLGLGPRSWLQEGDEHLANGEPQQALSLYRRMERTRGATPDTHIRIGNALYRMEDHGRAAAVYLEALRHVALEESEARFIASFNLGNTLLVRERYEEAREHFWTALLENPDSLEAKFNYEWASERIPPPRAPQTPPESLLPPQSGAGAGEAGGQVPEDGPAGTPGGESGGRQAQLARQRAAPALSESEAQRWIETIEDSMHEPLRRQATRALGSGPRGQRRGQTW